MLDKVTSKNFKDIVGTNAVLTIMNGPDVPLKVEEVLEVKVGKDDDRPDCCRKKPFSVILSGPESYQAPDGSYDLSFEKIGVLEAVYVDNRSDNPESEDFNTQVVQAVAAAKKSAAKAKKKGDADASSDASQAAAPAEPVVLYEITFG